MKYLFIELLVQDGERSHTHKILHTTTGNDIKFAAERYASTYWGYGSYEHGIGWWFDGEIVVKVNNVIELTKEEFECLDRFI